MNSPFALLSRTFAVLAGVFWLATVLALGWQLWLILVEKSFQTLTVQAALVSMWGAVPNFSADSLQVLFAVLSGLSLVVVFGVCAMALSALARLFG